MEVKRLSISDAKLMSRFYTSNYNHLSKWEPHRDSHYHSVDAWVERLKAYDKEHLEELSAHFVLYDNTEKEITAICSLTNIIKGPFQACHMGYAVSLRHQGRGLMKKLCRHTISFAFNDLNLNRIMANYMLRNDRSEALLKQLGFTKEGVAKKYLKINGYWEDHVLTSLLNPNNTHMREE